MQNKFIIIIFISLFSFGNVVTGQKLINSPYSRFNIGTLVPEGSFRSLGMGNVGIAMRDNSSIYFANPASYSSLDTISFVFDMGIGYTKNYIPNGDTRYSSDEMNFHHILMGFPLAKGWGVGLGVVPMSSGEYKVTQNVSSTDQGYNPVVGEYGVFHGGNGTIYKFFVGSGLKITKNLSLGANMTVLSGQLNRTNEFIFADFYNVFHSSVTEKLYISGINFDYGLQYTASLKNNYFLNIGASLTTGHNYNSKYNMLSLKYTAYSVRDTISYIADNYAKTFIPNTLRVGIAFGKKNKFTAGIDYIATKWSTSVIPGSTDYAADVREVLFGAEFIPDKYSNYSYISRIEYRIGGHYGDNYLTVNGAQLKEYGASIGIGLPMRIYSKTNLFFDFTRKSGPSSFNLHTEDIISMGISLNLYDYWFMKRKYD